MYIHTFTCVCEYQGRFSSLLSLKYITYSFLSPFLLSVCRVSPVVSCPVLSSVSRDCRAVCPLSFSPFVPIWRAIEAPRRPSVCRSVCCAACLLLVSRQAQDGVTVGTDAPRICPRQCPCLLLPMCCRVFRRLFRCPFRGLSCCLLPVVVWW